MRNIPNTGFAIKASVFIKLEVNAGPFIDATPGCYLAPYDKRARTFPSLEIEQVKKCVILVKSQEM